MLNVGQKEKCPFSKTDSLSETFSPFEKKNLPPLKYNFEKSFFFFRKNLKKQEMGNFANKILIGQLKFWWNISDFFQKQTYSFMGGVWKTKYIFLWASSATEKKLTGMIYCKKTENFLAFCLKRFRNGHIGNFWFPPGISKNMNISVSADFLDKILKILSFCPAYHICHFLLLRLQPKKMILFSKIPFLKKNQKFFIKILIVRFFWLEFFFEIFQFFSFFKFFQIFFLIVLYRSGKNICSKNVFVLRYAEHLFSLILT